MFFSQRACRSVSSVLPIAVIALAASAAAQLPDDRVAVLSGDESIQHIAGKSLSAVVLDATVEMTCVPPSAGMAPPCIVPTGIDPELVAPDPSGELRVLVFDDDTALFWIELEGLSPDLVITAWQVFVPAGAPSPAPIFEPIGPGLPPIAAPSAPLAATTARFSEGAGWEPNRLRIRSNGGGFLLSLLDYNPLEPHQAPMRNGLMSMHQGEAPEGSVAEQPLCCPDAVVPPAPGPRLLPIGSSFLRRLDPETGFQALGPDGRPELLRSPIPVPLIVIIVHIDRMTHGIHPGIVIPPIPGSSFPPTAGDHYVIGVFPLGGLGMS